MTTQDKQELSEADLARALAGADHEKKFATSPEDGDHLLKEWVERRWQEYIPAAKRLRRHIDRLSSTGGAGLADPKEIADEIMDTLIDEQNLTANDLLSDDQAALLHIAIISRLSVASPPHAAPHAEAGSLLPFKLRQAAAWLDQPPPPSVPLADMKSPSRMMRDAADEIDRLSRTQQAPASGEIGRLRTALRPFALDVGAVSLSKALGHISRQDLLGNYILDSLTLVTIRDNYVHNSLDKG